MANYLTTNSPGDAGKQEADAQAQASLNRRRAMASNALVTAYGPQAADPDAWATSVGASTVALEAPAKVADTYTTTNTNALKLDQAKRADQAWQLSTTIKAAKSLIDSGVAPDQVQTMLAPHLDALGVSPADGASALQMIAKDPTHLDAQVDMLDEIGKGANKPKLVGTPQMVSKVGADGKPQLVARYATTDDKGNNGTWDMPLAAGENIVPPNVGSGIIVNTPSGPAVQATPKYSPAVTPLAGKPVALDQGQQRADADTYRALHPGVIVTPGVDASGTPTSIITDRTSGAQRVSNPGAAPAAAVSEADKSAAGAVKNAAAADALSVTYSRTSAVPMAVDQALAYIPHMATNPVVRRFNVHVPGTAEYNFEQTLKQIGTNLSLDDLRNLRASGTSLGRVTNAEFTASGNAFANNDIGQPLNVLRGNMVRVKGTYSKINENLQADATRLKNAKPALPTAAPGGGWSVIGVK